MNCPHCGKPIENTIAVNAPDNVAGCAGVQPTMLNLAPNAAACNPIVIHPGQTLSLNFNANGCAGGSLYPTYIQF